jgi:hypothetical protein
MLLRHGLIPALSVLYYREKENTYALLGETMFNTMITYLVKNKRRHEVIVSFDSLISLITLLITIHPACTAHFIELKNMMMMYPKKPYYNDINIYALSFILSYTDNPSLEALKLLTSLLNRQILFWSDIMYGSHRCRGIYIFVNM